MLDGPEEEVDYSIGIPLDIGLGDTIVLSSIPENYYHFYGKKLIDECKSWIFDYNPYVVREDTPRHPVKKIVGAATEEFQFLIETLVDHRVIDKAPEWYKNAKYPLDTKAERFANKLGISEIICRTPRLYRYEDPSLVKKDQVVIHTDGNSTLEVMGKHVIDKIKERYKSYKIMQVGLTNSKGCENEDIGVIDKRNLDIWETVELIATSAIFIGVNSGPLHIANCYPHINKKVIINTDNKFNKQDVKGFRPLEYDVHADFQWLDYGLQYYNDTEFDIGCTHSYKKI